MGGGYLVLKNKAEAPVVEPATLNTPPPADVTSDWETVRNSWRGTSYELKLPSDFVNKPTPERTEWHHQVFENNGTSVTILVEPLQRLSSVADGQFTGSLEQVATLLDTRNTYDAIVFQTEAVIDGVPAIKQDKKALWDNGSSAGPRTIFVDGDNFVVLELEVQSTQSIAQEIRDLNDQILSTFRFTK